MYQLRGLSQKNSPKGQNQIFTLRNSQDIGSSSLSGHGIRIQDASLYGQHCRIFKIKNQWVVETLDAPFIEVNQKTVTRSEIQPGDTLKFGDLLWQFEMCPPSRKSGLVADNIWVFWAILAIVLQVLIVVFLESKMS